MASLRSFEDLVAIMDRLRQWVGSKEMEDDVTFLLVEATGPQAREP